MEDKDHEGYNKVFKHVANATTKENFNIVGQSQEELAKSLAKTNN